MIVLAHRGLTGQTRENTAAALVAAGDHPGVDGVEFDVRLTRDRVPVLHHDETLARLSGLPDRLADLTWPVLQTRTATGPAPVAALAEILPELLARGQVDLEIKEVAAAGPILDLLESDPQLADLAHLAVSSFLPDALAQLEARRPDIPRWLNANNSATAVLELARHLRAAALILPFDTLTPTTARQTQAAGCHLGCWGIRSGSDLQRAAELGVTIAIADLPFSTE